MTWERKTEVSAFRTSEAVKAVDEHYAAIRRRSQRNKRIQREKEEYQRLQKGKK